MTKVTTKEVVEEVETESDKLWDGIKDLELDLYALPGQFLHLHAERKKVVPDAVHLKLKSTAVLAALEAVLLPVKLADDKVYEITSTQAYTVVRKVPKVL